MEIKAVVPVPINPNVEDAWAMVMPYLQEAIDREDVGRSWSTQGMREAAAQQPGRYVLWALTQGTRIVGAMLTCFTSYPNRTVLEIVALAAQAYSITDWETITDPVRAYASTHGAVAVTGRGRAGWAKVLQATRTTTLWEVDLGE